MLVADIDFTYWSVRSSSRRGEDGVKGMNGGGVVILASYKFHFVNDRDNLV